MFHLPLIATAFGEDSRRAFSPSVLQHNIADILNEARDRRVASDVIDCRLHLQIVHVQDSTVTFADDFAEMIASDTISQLVEHLQTTYGPTEYTIAGFHDKAMPITGHGVSGGWWDEERWENSLGGRGQKNVCYKLFGGFTSDPDVAQDRFESIMVNGGKDFMENQWDAMRKAAMDPAVMWDLRDYDDEGLPIIRLVMLITDDGAHTAPETFGNNVRNPNREWLRQSGPWSNNLNNIYQKCDIEASRALINNINTEYGNLTSGQAAGANLAGDGACWGWNSAKAGTLRSLKGNLSFMEYFYGFGEDEEIISIAECGPVLEQSNCQDYNSFINCCTTWGLTYRAGWCDAQSEHWDRFPDHDTCMAFGGKYARCHPSMIDTYGGYTGSSDHPMRRAKACIEDSPEWTAAQQVEPTEEFLKGLDWMLDIDDIVEYPYDDPFAIDCTTHEYPNPRDSRFMDAFVGPRIHPVIITSPPSDKVVNNPSSDSLVSYDAHALRMSANNCPGLEHDPYTTYVCNSRLFGNYYCYTPIDYPQFYPYDRSDAGLWSTDATSWWRNRCDTQDCADQWWTQCMEVEYKEILDDFPIESAYELMRPDHIPEIIIAAVSRVIEEASTWGECTVIPTTTSDVIETTKIIPTSTGGIIDSPIIVPTSTGDVIETTTDMIVTTESPVITTDLFSPAPTCPPADCCPPCQCVSVDSVIEKLEEWKRAARDV